MNKKLSLFPPIGALIFMILSSISLYAESLISTGLLSNKALEGYDTVAYFTQGKPIKGVSDFTIEYKDAQWYFSSAENLKLFKQNPTKYAPQYGGYCAWAIAHNATASGDPKQWHIEDGKLYLNYDKNIQEQWFPRRQELIPVADKNFPTLIP